MFPAGLEIMMNRIYQDHVKFITFFLLIFETFTDVFVYVDISYQSNTAQANSYVIQDIALYCKKPSTSIGPSSGKGS